LKRKFQIGSSKFQTNQNHKKKIPKNGQLGIKTDNSTRSHALRGTQAWPLGGQSLAAPHVQRRREAVGVAKGPHD
jgi:hypothetical protein